MAVKLLETNHLKLKYLSTLFALFPLFLSGCYLVKQGQGQLKLHFDQVPLERAIVEEEKRDFQQLLQSIPNIKKFAIEAVGLKKNDNYTGYFETTGKGITYVVTAANRTTLSQYTWWFPIVGSVPYKGFFDLEDAKSLLEELEQSGYDTWLFAAPAYSTLGWFQDPVTTPMLRRGSFSLTESIIHEMVHATLYVEGKGDFNEQLATFVGVTAAFQYFNDTQQLSPQELQKVTEKKERRRQFSRVVQSYIPELERLYATPSPENEKLELRKKIFSQLAAELKASFPKFPNKDLVFNNARILQYQRYKEESPIFKNFWEKSEKRWPQFWEQVNKYAENL